MLAHHGYCLSFLTSHSFRTPSCPTLPSNSAWESWTSCSDQDRQELTKSQLGSLRSDPSRSQRPTHRNLVGGMPECPANRSSFGDVLVSLTRRTVNWIFIKLRNHMFTEYLDSLLYDLDWQRCREHAEGNLVDADILVSLHRLHDLFRCSDAQVPLADISIDLCGSRLGNRRRPYREVWRLGEGVEIVEHETVLVAAGDVD